MRNAEKLLRDWDYDQDGFISQNEVSDTENQQMYILQNDKKKIF